VWADCLEFAVIVDVAINLYSSIHADTSWASVVARTNMGIGKPETFTRFYLESQDSKVTQVYQGIYGPCF